MLELFVRESHETFDARPILEPMRARELERLRADEPLGHPEHRGIRAALNLAPHASLLGREKRHVARSTQAIRQELAAEIEAAAPEDIRVDVPAHAFRSFDAALIASAIRVVVPHALADRIKNHVDGCVHRLSPHTTFERGAIMNKKRSVHMRQVTQTCETDAGTNVLLGAARSATGSGLWAMARKRRTPVRRFLLL